MAMRKKRAEPVDKLTEISSSVHLLQTVALSEAVLGVQDSAHGRRLQSVHQKFKIQTSRTELLFQGKTFNCFCLYATCRISYISHSLDKNPKRYNLQI